MLDVQSGKTIDNPAIFVGADGRITNVADARTVFVLKRSMASGFAGIENPLFYKENSRMLFGDAKESIGGLIREFS